jgi:hypothetical protein
MVTVIKEATIKEALYFKHSGSIKIDLVKSYEAVSTSQKNL